MSLHAILRCMEQVFGIIEMFTHLLAVRALDLMMWVQSYVVFSIIASTLIIMWTHVVGDVTDKFKRMIRFIQIFVIAHAIIAFLAFTLEFIHVTILTFDKSIEKYEALKHIMLFFEGLYFLTFSSIIIIFIIMEIAIFKQLQKAKRMRFEVASNNVDALKKVSIALIFVIIACCILIVGFITAFKFNVAFETGVLVFELIPETISFGTLIIIFWPSKTRSRTRSITLGKEEVVIDEEVTNDTSCQMSAIKGHDPMIDETLTHPILYKAFYNFSKKEFSSENVLFYKSVEKFKKLESSNDIKMEIARIYFVFLHSDGKHALNVFTPATKKAIDRIERNDITPDMFDDVLFGKISIFGNNYFIRGNTYFERRPFEIP